MLTRDEWWAYVVKHEIEPTIRSFLRPRLTDGKPLRWPFSPIQPSRPDARDALGARTEGRDPGQPGETGES